MEKEGKNRTNDINKGKEQNGRLNFSHISNYINVNGVNTD